MVFLRKEIETLSTDYPKGGMPFDTLENIGWYLGTAWQRIETYIRTRYSEREVVWVIEGSEGDEWCPPLEPVVSHTALRWESAWVSVSHLRWPSRACFARKWGIQGYGASGRWCAA